MKKTKMTLSALAIAASFSLGTLFAEDATPSTQKLPFSVYSDQGDHFVPAGWMGDSGDLTFNDHFKVNPGQGAKCIQVKYSGKAAGGQKWSGIYWQEPANNWGATKGAGFNLTGAKKIKFMARGDKGGEMVEFKAGGISSGDFPDSFKAEAPITTLTAEWKEYEIDLSGQDLSHVIGGFCFALNKDHNSDGATFYLDNIRYE